MDRIPNLMDVTTLEYLATPTLDSLWISEGMPQSAAYATDMFPEPEKALYEHNTGEDAA
jgi:hypothetical protein